MDVYTTVYTVRGEILNLELVRGARLQHKFAKRGGGEGQDDPSLLFN